MDYLYGKLNKEVEKVYYEGKETSTARVTVDNKDATIKVDVIAHKDPVSSVNDPLVAGYSENGTLRTNAPTDKKDAINLEYFEEHAADNIPVEAGESEYTLKQKAPEEIANHCGCKAWFWRCLNTQTKTLYLTATQPSASEVIVSDSASYEEFGDWGISVGDRLSLINDTRHDFCAVEAINGNAITLQENPFTVKRDDTSITRYTVMDADNPGCGIYDMGYLSTALGARNLSLQIGAFSAGNGNESIGAWSTTSGRENKAGFCATAIGNRNQATGTYSISFGGECKSTESCALSTGSGTEANGIYSASFGRFTKANKQASVSYGFESEAHADFSFAHGYRTSATQKCQFVTGRYNKESDPTHSNPDGTTEMFIVGNGSLDNRSNAAVITDLGSLVLHSSTIGTGVYASVVAGSTNRVNASNSIIAGRNGTINSADSILVGATNDDGFVSEINAKNSAAFGMGVRVQSGHRASTVTGFGTKSSNSYCLVGGLYNAGISGNLFEIGNGTKTTGSNAFSVARNGRAKVGANPVDDMDIVPKKYADDRFISLTADQTVSGKKTFSGITVSNTLYKSYTSASVNNPYISSTDFPSNDRAGVVAKVGNGGITVGGRGVITMAAPSDAIVKSGSNAAYKISPSQQHMGVFYGLSKAAGADISAEGSGETAPDGTNSGVYPESSKTAIRNLIDVPKKMGVSSDDTHERAYTAVTDGSVGTTFRYIYTDNSWGTHYDGSIAQRVGGRLTCKDPINNMDAVNLQYFNGDSESYTISTWTALSASNPYDYQATVTATHTIGNNTTVELINDQAVLFATHGFAIGSVNGQSITIYSIGEPSSSVTLEVNYRG